MCAWNSEIRSEVLVFSGSWYKDERLFQDIQDSTLDSLILENGLKGAIVTDVNGFFAQEELYRRYRIPLKRGILLIGPPGNGKTHFVKGLINQLSHPCLYVRSFLQRHDTDHSSIRAVFHRAREVSPCVLVLEDLDSLLTDGNRSYFLNEMDGFAANNGILTLASTNHPGRLDPAILERPSRFHRKYTFGLPAIEGRLSYLRLFSNGLEPDLQLEGADLEAVAMQTEGFSYAYLKELYLSAIMLWIEEPGSKRIAQLMIQQADALLEQMRTMTDQAAVGQGEDFAMEAAMAHFRSFGAPMPWSAGSD